MQKITAQSSERKTKTADQPAEVLPPTIPWEVRAFLGESPVLPGDDPGVYNNLMMRVSRALNPTDVLDWVFVEDVVYATFMVHTLRNWKMEILRDGRHEALSQALIPSYLLDNESPEKARESAELEALEFQESPHQHRDSIQDHLANMGLNLDSVLARGLVLRLQEVEAIDRMISVELSRRDAALRQADQWRTGIGRRLRAATQDFVDIDPATGT